LTLPPTSCPTSLISFTNTISRYMLSSLNYLTHYPIEC
jgi:hypothetical protein